MSRRPEFHERFADWLGSRPAGADDDPPRDIALHAAACDRCLREATALDGLASVDVAAVDLPLVPIGARHTRGIPSIARYGIAGAAMVLVGGAVAIGATLIPDGRPPSGAAAPQSFGEGVLAGTPSTAASASLLASPTPSPSPSTQPTISPEAADESSLEPVAPTTAALIPTAQPLPTVAPIVRPIPPTTTPSPTASAAATPTLAPTPVPTPTAPPPTASPTPAPTVSPTATPPAP